MKSLILVSALFAQSLIASTISEESLDDLSLEELMNIKIYSATKSYQRIEEIPANITVITRKDIEKYILVFELYLAYFLRCIFHFKNSAKKL